MQFFQRQIIQVCPVPGAALMNMLDPEIFPYTQVNGSTFPAPDDAMKSEHPAGSDPNYAENISAFVQPTCRTRSTVNRSTSCNVQHAGRADHLGRADLDAAA